MLYSRLFMGAALLCSFFAILLLASALCHIEQPYVTAMLAATALLAASAGWLATNSINISIKIRERTFDYLQKATVNRQISELLKSVNLAWHDEDIDGIISDGKLTEYFIINYYNSAAIENIKHLGNIIEEMALAIRFKTVDNAMLCRSFNEIVALYVDRLQPFLPLFRNDPVVDNHPYKGRQCNDIFAEALWLARHWQTL